MHDAVMAEAERKLEPATMADLEALPANVKGEIIAAQAACPALKRQLDVTGARSSVSDPR